MQARHGAGLTHRDEHFYQLGLRQFGAFDRLRLDPAPSLRDLLSLAAEYEHGIKENDLDPEVVVQVSLRRLWLGKNGTDRQKLYDLLMDKREMVDEYFSLAISDEGAVETLPMLLRGYTPNLDRLPEFLLCLAARVSP